MEHQDTKLTSMRPRLKELNDNPYLTTTDKTKYNWEFFLEQIEKRRLMNLFFYPPNILLPQKSQYFSCYPRTRFGIGKGMMVVVQTIATGCGNSVKLVVLQVRKHPA